MRRIFYILFLLFFAQISFAQSHFTVSFENCANGKRIVLNDSVYTNAFGEKYTISKLKYYISNIHLTTNTKETNESNVFLMSPGEKSISIPYPKGKITGIEFLLGVDSALNCSGAQNGALDPLNDMFWTWNNGYVMFKLEGASAASTADQNRIQYHIGGYKGEFKTMRKVFLPIIYQGEFSSPGILISLNLDSFWNGENKIHISELPVIMSQGQAASKIADNFSEMFLIRAYQIRI